jgi:hypothetical protein
MLSGTAQVSHQVCQFFCQFLSVPWDDDIVVSAGKLRKLWDSLSELRRSLCERRLESTVVRFALLHVKTAQFTQFLRQVWFHTVKSLSLTDSYRVLNTEAHRAVSSEYGSTFCSDWKNFFPQGDYTNPEVIIVLRTISSKWKFFSLQKKLTVELSLDQMQVCGIVASRMSANIFHKVSNFLY